MGNINNPEVLLKGSPEKVAEKAYHAIKSGVQIVGPECAIPLVTPIENLKKIVRVAEEENKK